MHGYIPGWFRSIYCDYVNETLTRFKIKNIHILVNVNDFWYTKSTKSIEYSFGQLMSFDKTIFQLTLFPFQSSTTGDAKRSMYYLFLNLTLKLLEITD